VLFCLRTLSRCLGHSVTLPATLCYVACRHNVTLPATLCYVARGHILSKNTSFNSSMEKPKQEAEVIPKTYGLLNIGFLNLQDGADRLSRNVGKELPLVVT